VTVPAAGASLVELPRRRNPEAVDVFVSAYQRDGEFALAFWEGRPPPAEMLRRIFRAAHAQQIALATPPLAVVEAGAVVAVANYVLPSGGGSLNPVHRLYCVWTALGTLRVPRRVRRRMSWYSRQAFRLLPYQPRCMVMQLAVAPSEQNRGHARVLLEAIRERSRADPRSTGVGISTYSEANVRLYERLGFRITGQSRRESTSVWALFAEH
jgi:GNAT superfamily N-acetyltransferase